MAKLTKAPVFYVVAQVTHSPILKLESLIPDLQERLRKDGFPGYRAHKQSVVEIRQDPSNLSDTAVDVIEETTHIFASRDQTESLLINPRSVSYQTVEYGTIDSFQEKFERGISAVRDVLAPDSFTRIGLRFLDAVVPLEGADLAAYVRTQFLGLQNILGDDWLTAYTFSETVVMRGSRQTKVRAITRSSSLSFPPDLAPLKVSMLCSIRMPPSRLITKVHRISTRRISWRA
jgi:uncharacterized protein (TIGR04255 family)